MTSVLRRAAVAACALACAAGSWAVDSSENAALRYWRAWSAVDDESMDVVADAQVSSPTEITPAVREAVADLEQSIGLLLGAASFERCDFAVDYDKGMKMLLPHLGPMRRSARLLATDAILHAEQGDTEGAVDRVSAIFTMSRHLSSEQTVISALVSASIFGIGDQAIERLDLSGLLTIDGRERLAQTIARFDAEDPFGVYRAVGFEQEAVVGWLRRSLSEDAGREQVVETLASFSNDVNAEALSRDRDVLLEELPQLELYYELAATAFINGEFDVLNNLERRAAEDEFGPLTKALAPAYSRMRDTTERAHTMFEKVAARLGVER